MRVNLGGREVNAIEADFEIGQEPWNSYMLADGGQVRVKTVVQKLLKIVDDQGNPLYDENGDPQIIVRSNVIVAASE